ncbi:MAG TPA: molybdenum cofactor biosynthesis protein MoaE [Gemmatimonadales bacterium]|nr:molybdenum cofactor biosynthesis protein MoaE [Gemmatimonadales bacterium]
MGFLSEHPLDVGALAAAVAGPGRGGTCTFLGAVRDHHAGRGVVELEYSAYGPMAEATIGAIVAEAERRWPVRVAAAHRLGRLAVGDAAVAVAAAGAHREEAFAACRFVIEELKRRVPIWKRERFADGTEAWVDPTAVEASR